MKTSARVAVGGVFGALAVACMCLTFIPMTEMLLPALAGMLMIPAAMELGRKWAWVMYAAVAILSLLIVPVWEAKLLFVAFFGYYPLVKGQIESLRRPIWEWMLKFLLFNVTMVVTYWLLLRFFHLDPESFEFFGVSLPLVVLAVGNVAFFLYDRAMSIFITVYIKRWQPRIGKIFRK